MREPRTNDAIDLICILTSNLAKPESSEDLFRIIGVKTIKFLFLKINLALVGFLVGGFTQSVGPTLESSFA